MVHDSIPHRRLFDRLRDSLASPRLNVDFSKLGDVLLSYFFFPRGIRWLPWFALPPDSFDGSGAVKGGRSRDQIQYQQSRLLRDVL